jgi:hypothetical protein
MLDFDIALFAVLSVTVFWSMAIVLFLCSDTRYLAGMLLIVAVPVAGLSVVGMAIIFAILNFGIVTNLVAQIALGVGLGAIPTIIFVLWRRRHL